MDYRKAINRIVMRRQSALDAAAALKARLIETDPQFYENERRLRLSQLALSRGENPDVDGLMKAREKLLSAHSLTPGDLDPPPSCPVCQDTGLDQGRPCRCAVKEAASDRQSFNDLTLHSLKDAELTVYSLKNRALIESIYDDADKFIEKFPDTNKKNIIFMGKSGAGKTFLAGCVAGALLKKGFSVVSMTAFGFVNSMLAYHTTFNEEKMKYLSPVLDCDLLVIDDLGSESILKNVTVEYLYLVLNERMTAGRHTLITTNLAPDALRARYGERIVSRLFDKRVARSWAFPDEDLRDALKKP